MVHDNCGKVNKKVLFIILGIALIIASVVTIIILFATAKIHKSPESVVEKYVKCYLKQDYFGIKECMSPSARKDDEENPKHYKADMKYLSRVYKDHKIAEVREVDSQNAYVVLEFKCKDDISYTTNVGVTKIKNKWYVKGFYILEDYD